MSPFCLPTGGGFQITLIEVEDSAKALTKSGAAPGSDFWMFFGVFFKQNYGVQFGVFFFNQGEKGVRRKKKKKIKLKNTSTKITILTDIVLENF